MYVIGPLVMVVVDEEKSDGKIKQEHGYIDFILLRVSISGRVIRRMVAACVPGMDTVLLKSLSASVCAFLSKMPGH